MLHAARGLPLLRVLSISNYASSLGHLAGLSGGSGLFRQARGQQCFDCVPFLACGCRLQGSLPDSQPCARARQGSVRQSWLIGRRARACWPWLCQVRAGLCRMHMPSLAGRFLAAFTIVPSCGAGAPVMQLSGMWRSTATACATWPSQVSLACCQPQGQGERGRAVAWTAGKHGNPEENPSTDLSLALQAATNAVSPPPALPVCPPGLDLALQAPGT